MRDLENKINVCLACDDNYAKYAGVVIASVLANASDSEKLNFYILDGGIQDEHKAQILELKTIKDCDINFVNVPEELFGDYKKIKTHQYVTLATYYRLKLPSLLTDVERVIYLDCDMVVNSGLKELFNTDMKESAVAGVIDINRRMVKKNPNYVNAGMLVMDINNMRQQNLEEKFLDWTKAHIETIKMGDQEVINEVLKGKIKIVSDEWNVQSSNFTNRSSYTHNPKIIHFVSKKKPWHWASFSIHRDLYFKYLQLTPWKLDEEELKHWTKDNQIASLIEYVKYRPLFLFRPRFYQAVFYTYLKPLLKKVFSIEDYRETHNVMKLFGLKIKYPKREYAKLKNQSPYEHYKKKNIDITTLPPAEGQIRDIQLANLALLKELDYVCKENGLKYWLNFGTLLGAVRHKGYIPWDDDIDVGMVRDDYNKIIEAFEKTSRNSDIYANYEFLGKAQTIIKIRHKKCSHLFVDIFPYEYSNAVENSDNRKLKTKKLMTIRQEMNKIKDLDNSEKVLDKVKEINKNIIPDIYVENSDIQCGLEYSYTEPVWVYPYEMIFPIREISFENYDFMSVNEPERYLENLFGEYMSYPKKFGFGHSMYLNLSDDDNRIVKELRSV